MKFSFDDFVLVACIALLAYVGYHLFFSVILEGFPT